MERINEFCESMAANGLQCPDAIVSDGVLHRFNVNGDKPGSKNGWYVLYGDNGLPAGAFGSWKLGQTFTWCGKEERTLTEDERAKWRERIAEAKKARDEEQKRLHSKAREKAAWIWENSKLVTEHPYLEAKNVKSRGLRQYKDSLVIPIQDTDGAVHSLQFIGTDGDKRFLSDGAIRGYLYPIDSDGDILLICEGYATGASLHEATGYAVAVAFNAGNLKPVCEALHKKSPDTKFVVCGDDDFETDGNPGITKAKAAVTAIGAVLAIPKFKDQAHRGTDFNDLHQIEGLEAVRQQIEEALRAPASQEETISPDVAQKTIEYLASLSPFEYEQQRQSMADKLGFRIGILDKEVERIRKANNPEGTKSLVEELEPWPEPVSGTELLDTIYQVALDYVIMPAKSAVAFSLWTLLTYCYDAFRILPVLELKSPEKRCGKTRLLEVLSGLAYRAFPSSNLTPATVYRVIEKCKPCFLIDEADTFLPQNDELRGILNSGHTVRNAFVTRCNSETNEPERFSTWCPKAIALIGKLPSTLDDRAIVISLKRKLTTEAVKRLSLSFDDECLHIRQRCKRWAIDNMASLKEAKPHLPIIDNDRALDNWTPLIAIAELAGDEWGKSARDSMENIEAKKEDDSVRVMLIQDIQKIFKDRKCETLWTCDLIEALVKIEDRPWDEWRKGKPISGTSVANLLNPFEIKSGEIRQGDKNRRGYELKQFADVFKRYVSQPPPSNQGATVLQPSDHASSEGNQNATDSEKVALQNSPKPLPIAKCSTVALQKGSTEEKDTKESDQVPEPLPKNDQNREVIPLW